MGGLGGDDDDDDDDVDDDDVDDDDDGGDDAVDLVDDVIRDKESNAFRKLARVNIFGR